MKTLLALLLCVAGCAGAQTQAPPTAAPTPPVCEVGGVQPVEQSMVDYGSTYTEGMNGPDPSAPAAHLIGCPVPGSRVHARAVVVPSSAVVVAQ